MELRYVYRRIEDAIGTPLDIQDSPHAELTRKLRHAFRETKDFAHRAEIQALCLSALAGNPRIDASATGEAINKLLDKACMLTMPYTKTVFDKDSKDSKSVQRGQIAKAFELLAQMNKTRETRKAKEAKEAGAKNKAGADDSPVEQKDQNTTGVPGDKKP